MSQMVNWSVSMLDTTTVRVYPLQRYGERSLTLQPHDVLGSLRHLLLTVHQETGKEPKVLVLPEDLFCQVLLSDDVKTAIDAMDRNMPLLLKLQEWTPTPPRTESLAQLLGVEHVAVID